MFFPNLINEKFCTTPIKITFHSEKVDRDGNPMEYEVEAKCNYQSSCSSIMQDDKKVIQISGKCYLPGDIFPELDNLTGGYVELFNNKIRRKIERGTKARNLDGSVNFTLLEIS